MPARLRHFSINADDLSRARRFYAAVFGWTFESWGPPGFFLIEGLGDSGSGSLQERRELVPGQRIGTFETTFAVDDIVATLTAVTANGGRVLMHPHRIEGVGEIGYFEDTEGNVCGVGQYDRDRPR